MMTARKNSLKDGQSPEDVAAAYWNDLQQAGVEAFQEAGTWLSWLSRFTTTENTIWILGNGGSSANAEHMAHDISQACHRAGRPARAVAPSSHVALSAFANDISYQEALAMVLAVHAKPHDALLLLSVSGESKNLIRAAKHAREQGMESLAFVGRDSTLSSTVDQAFIFGAADYGLSEDIQVMFGHAAVRAIQSGMPQTVMSGSQSAGGQRG